MLVLPDQVTVPKALEFFHRGGTLKDPEKQAAVEKPGAKLAMVLVKLKT